MLSVRPKLFNMKNLLKTYLVCYLVFLSCTQNYFVKTDPGLSTYENKINYLGERQTGEIYFRNTKNLVANNIKIYGDTLNFTHSETLRDSSVALSQVSKIRFKDRKLGFAYGVFSGAGLGLLSVAALLTGSTEPGSSYAIIGIIGAGALVGGIIGGSKGSHHEFIFEYNINKSNRSNFRINVN